MSPLAPRDPRADLPLHLNPAMTVDGAEVVGTGTPLTVYDPATGRQLAEIPEASTEQTEAAVASARRAFPGWADLDGDRRAGHLHRLADAMEERFDRLLATVIGEVGTPVTLAEKLQVQYPIDQLRWFADAARTPAHRDLGTTDYGVPRRGVVYGRPVGVVAAISAYNYPLHLGMWKVGAALAAGCTVVLMPSPRAPLAVLELGRIAVEAGLPPGVLNVVVGGPEVGRALTEHPAVDKVSFTGSDGVGRQIVAQAAPGLKRVTLELGGKSAAIVLPGADLRAAAAALHPRYARNAGQGCASPTRILVHRSELDAFLQASKPVYDSLTVGDPWRPDTVVGPVIRPEHRARIEDMVAGAVDRGATVALGGGRPDHQDGWWVNPHLITGIGNDDPLAQEEVFGPVAVLMPYADLDEAVRTANGTRYGLSAYLQGDPVLAERIAGRLRAGTVSINEAAGLRPDAPFGGFGHSGLGREGGEWGLAAYLEPQHVQSPLGRGGAA
ncbi:aldehyde dehydrogenase family protein [Streptomyces sp. NPDC058045]|uniref:aldehyde dehydrogenase family protein n=1 Tax=Streptomyces sp. NPDC058045 TaxID=3346311 RepID=UPI0036EF7FA9